MRKLKQLLKILLLLIPLLAAIKEFRSDDY